MRPVRGFAEAGRRPGHLHTNRQKVFCPDSDRTKHLKLMSQNLEDAGVRVLAWCLMKNHVHFVAVPDRGDSQSVLWRRVHRRFAQMLNARLLRSGRLWQNRSYSCALSPTHLWRALAFADGQGRGGAGEGDDAWGGDVAVENGVPGGAGRTGHRGTAGAGRIGAARARVGREARAVVLLINLGIGSEGTSKIPGH